MPLSHSLRLMAFLIFCLVALSFAHNSMGRARLVVGEVAYAKSSESGWQHLRVNQKVHPNSQIRTYEESETNIAFADGSSIDLEESSQIVFSEMSSENGVYRYTLDVDKGTVAFDVKNQENDDSRASFRIRQNVIADTRGAVGILGIMNGGYIFVSVRSGKIAVKLGSERLAIEGGQTVFALDGSLIVMNLKNSGSRQFVDQLKDALSNATLTKNPSLAKKFLVKKSKEINAASSAEHEKSIEEELKFFEFNDQSVESDSEYYQILH